MSGLTAGFKSLFKTSKKRSVTEKSEGSPGAHVQEGRKLHEEVKKEEETPLGWADIKKVIEAQRSWNQMKECTAKTEWQAVLDVSHHVAGWDDGRALPKPAFRKAFEDGTALTCTISRLLAAKIRSALQSDCIKETVVVLTSREFASAMYLTGWLCETIESTVINVASSSIPSLVVAFLQSVAGQDLPPASHEPVFTVIFPTLRSLVVHPTCVDDLTRGGYLRTLLELLLRGLHKPNIPLFPARAASESADLLILASRRSLSHVAALKPITTLLSEFHRHLKSPSMQAVPLPENVCIVQVAVLRIVSELLKLLDMQIPTPIYSNQIMGFNRTGVELCATAAIRSCQYNSAESVVLFSNLVYISNQGGESGGATVTSQSESIFSDRARAPSIMFTESAEGSTLAKNSAVFGMLPKIAEESDSAAQQRVAECMMKIFSDHKNNYSLLHKTQVLPKLLHKLGSLQPMGQMSVIQVLQFVVQQLNYRPEQAIFMAVHKVGEQDLPPRLVTSLLRMFMEFIKLDPTFRNILKDAGLTSACNLYFKNLLTTQEPSTPEQSRCAEAALDICLLMMEGKSDAAHQHLMNITKNEGVLTLLKCMTSKVLHEDIRKAMRKFLLAAAAVDARREECGGIFEALMSYLATGVSNIGVDWACIGEGLGVLLKVVATQPSCRPVFSRLRLAGGIQIPLALLRPLSGLGKTASEPDPPLLAPAVTRLAWALSGVMSVRHTPDLGTFCGASRSLCTVLGARRAVWDMLYASVGYWLDASTHDALISALGTPTEVCRQYYIKGMPTAVMFPAALSGALGIIPQLSSVEAKGVINFIQGNLAGVPLLVPGDVAGANAVVELAEKEWASVVDDTMLDFLIDEPEGVLEALLPDALSAWCQPSHIRRLAAFVKNPPGPVASLEQAAKSVAAVARKPRNTNQIAFNGVASSVLTLVNPAIQWPPSGITISCWFEFSRPPVSSDHDPSTQPGPIVTRLSWMDQENRKLFVQLGIDGRNHLVLVSNYITEISNEMREEPMPQLHTFLDYEFKEGTKYHIVMVHHKQAMMKMVKSEAVLYVNGAVVQRLPVPYPPSTQHTSPRLKASCGLGKPRATRPYGDSWATGGRLQVAQLRILGNSACPASVLSMYALGPAYQGPYDTASTETLAVQQMTSRACPVLTPAQLALLDHPASNWPDGTETIGDACIWLLLPSTGADQSVPVVSKSNNVPAEPIYSGNVVSMVWASPGGSIAVLAAQRGMPQLLLGWALEGQAVGLGKPSQQAIRQTILCLLSLLRCTADIDPLVSDDYSLHEGIAGLLREHPALCDDQVVEAIVYATVCNGAVRSLPLVKHILLDGSLWRNCGTSSAVLALEHLRQCVCDGKLKHFNALRLQRGADMTRALLYMLIGEPGKPPHHLIMQGAVETMEQHLAALAVDQFSLETAFLDICRFIGHLIKETGFEGISTQLRHFVSNRLMKLLLDLVISGKPSLDSGFGCSRNSDFIGASVMHAFTNAAGISPKVKRKQSSKDPFTEAILHCTDVRWFVNILERARHPVMAVLTLKLLGRTFALPDRVGTFRKTIAASRVIAENIDKHCNQPEVYAMVVGLLCDNPAKDHTIENLASVGKFEKSATESDAEFPLFGTMLSIALSLSGASYAYAAGLGKQLLFSRPVNSNNLLMAIPTHSARDRWRRLMTRVRAFVWLKVRLGLNKMGCTASSPIEGRVHVVDGPSAVKLADEALLRVAACLRTGGTRLDAFMKSEDMLSSAVDVVFSTIRPLPVTKEDTADEFVFIDNDPEQFDALESDGDGDDASDDSNLSYSSLDLGTTSPRSSTWVAEDGPFPCNLHKSPILQVIACGVCGAVLRDTPWTIIAKTRKSKRSTERDSPAAAILHRVLNSFPANSSLVAQSSFQLAVAKAVLTAMHTAIDVILTEAAFLQNAVSILSYLTTRLCSGYATPVPELMNFGADILHGMESKQLVPFKGLWTQFINRASLWLLSSNLHPKELPLEYGINTLLASLPMVLHISNGESVFLQQLVYLLHQLMKVQVDTVQDKVLVVMRLLVDTFRNSPSLVDVFISPKRNLLQGGFDQLDGTVSGTTRFKEWSASHENELNDFFSQKHMTAHQKWRRREEKQKVWLKLVVQEAKTAAADMRIKQENYKSKNKEWSNTYDLGVEMEPCVFAWPTTSAALLRCSPRTVIPPFAAVKGVRWPSRVASVLGPCMPAVSEAPVAKTKRSDEERKDEHAAYRLCCLASTDDGLTPLCAMIHTPPTKVAGQVESETVDGLSQAASWFCNVITAKHNDTAQHVFNASRVWYLESIPTLVIVGQKSVYLASHCRRNEQGDVEYYPARLSRTGPPVNTAEAQKASNKQNKSAVGGLLAHGWKGLKGVVGRPGALKQKGTDEEKEHRVLLSMTLVHLFSQGCVMEIPLGGIAEVVKRRTHHEDVALEITTEVGKAFLLTVMNLSSIISESERNRMYKVIIAAAPYATCPDHAATLGDLTQMWRVRMLTNYDYILTVNAVAGRTFSDLNQYPVIPWVLASYDTPTIDLSDRSVYRDLSKPMGALDNKRAASFEARFSEWDDPEIPKFHYGSHYSTPMMVLWYLTRLQPYTSMAVVYQGGKLDLADRLFHSVADAWHSASRGSNTDVKELVPEFYTSSEFLLNTNSLNLGANREGTVLNDVVLPPWAASPEHFIAVQRAALESEHVSANLHKWVDLIFGATQLGEEAERKLNVFYHLSYKGGLSRLLETAEDPGEKWAAATQVAQFGQTPKQLWTGHHHQRNTSPLSSNARLAGVCKHAQASKCYSGVLFSATGDYQTGSSFTWVNVTSTEGCGQMMLLSPGLGRLGSAQGYIDMSKRDGFARVYCSGDGQLAARLPLPCGMKGASVTAMLHNSFIAFCGTPTGILAMQINAKSIPSSATPSPWTASGHPAFKSITPLYRLVSHWGPVDRLVHIPDTSLLISSSNDGGQPVVWHAGHRQGAYCGHLKEHKGQFIDAKVLHNRRWLFTCSADTVYIFHTKDLSKLARVKVPDFSSSIGAVTAVEPVCLSLIIPHNETAGSAGKGAASTVPDWACNR